MVSKVIYIELKILKETHPRCATVSPSHKNIPCSRGLAYLT